MKRNTKSALLFSVVSIIICCTMLLGTTMAWFTDSVTSAKNVIVAGNLDVELYHGDNKVDANYSVFPEADAFLWEPGAVIYENLKIENEGNLALKYQLTLSDLEATETPDGKTLKDVIKVGIVEGGFTAADANVDDRTEAINAVNGAWNDFDKFFAKGELLADDDDATTDVDEDTDVYGIVLYWAPSDNDNDYNMNNDNQGTELKITFGINLVATQLEAEEDSFDNTYDEGAYLPVVYTAEELISALENGDSVKLGNDIVLPETVEIPVGADVVIDLNGKEISKDVDEGIVLRNYGSLTLSGEGTVDGTMGNYAIRTESGTSLTINEGVVVDGGFGAISCFGGTLTINGGDFSNEESNTTHYVVYATNNSNVIINGGTFTFGADQYAGSNGSPILAATNGSIIEINGGTFEAEGGSALCYNANNIVIKGGTFKNRAYNTYGGTIENKLAEGYKVEQVGSEYIVVPENVEIVTDATELGDAIANAENGDVIEIMADITGNVKVTQKADVDFTIDGNGNDFNGIMTVFGNGRKTTAGLTIKNVNFVAANGASSCIVSPDRTVNNAYSYSSNVTIENCTFTDPDGVVNCAAVRHEDGGDSNWKIIDCVVDNTMHSLIQTNNVELDGLTIQGCEVYSKNGINLNQCTKVSIIDCEIDVKGYAVRYGVNGSTVNGNFEIKDSTLKSANDDGDAVIIFRGTMTGSTLTITNTTITGTPEFTGTANVVFN